VVLFAASALLATTTVTVDDGDTLWGLAHEHGVSVDELVAWNELDDPDRIYLGTQLIVHRPNSQVDRARAEATTHTVAAGETLSAIAARYTLSIAELVGLNDLDDPDHITVGAAIVVSQPVSRPATHIVLPGQTLSAIAAEYGLSVGALVTGNGLDDPDRIRSGQKLSLAPPAVQSVTTTTTVAPAPTIPAPTADEPTDAAPPVVIPQPDAGRTPLADAFALWSQSYGAPQELLEAIAWHASDWQPAITGPDGRVGITQLRPDAVELVSTRLLGLDLDPLATSDGVRLAARYLRYLIDRTHSDREALLAWHDGLGPLLERGPTAAAEAFADAVLEIRRMRA